MADTLDRLRSGASFAEVLGVLNDASPFAGTTWVHARDIAQGYDNAERWDSEGAFEAVSEDLAVAVDEGLITVGEYDEAIAVAGR